MVPSPRFCEMPNLTGRRWAWPGAVALLVAGALPLLGPVDAWLDGMLDAWRSCAGEAVAVTVSNLVKPVGVAVLAAAVLRALWLGRPRPVEIARILVRSSRASS